MLGKRGARGGIKTQVDQWDRAASDKGTPGVLKLKFDAIQDCGVCTAARGKPRVYSRIPVRTSGQPHGATVELCTAPVSVCVSA